MADEMLGLRVEREGLHVLLTQVDPAQIEDIQCNEIRVHRAQIPWLINALELCANAIKNDLTPTE